MNKKAAICLECKETLTGRVDQKFCSPYCKSSFHYKKNKEKELSGFKKIDESLKLNRRILKRYNQTGQSYIKTDILKKEGFNPKYFTHYWKAKNGNVYLFCYEYGYRNIEDGRTLLIEQQDYMK